MQVYNLLSLFICANSLAQGTPLLESTVALSRGLADVSGTDSALDKKANTDPGVASHDTHVLTTRQNTITRFAPLRGDQVLQLVSGALIAVTAISFSGNVPAPAIDGSITTTLDSIGTQLGLHALQNPGSTALRATVGLMQVTWEYAGNQTPALTSLEWQTLLVSMYRALAAQSSQGDFISVKYDVGGLAFMVELGLM